MSKEQRAEVKALIRFYERRGWDWSSAATFLCVKYEGVLERIIRPWPIRRAASQGGEA